ncbi:response regulator [Paenibacillus sp. AR247]|uniref:response regulator n=1 Tax=Paenibacillus sp. AR247 TaxID=1631599 RepID=UPI0026C82ED7|nr:response regulator [Paenibacillus sp. AR247]
MMYKLLLVEDEEDVRDGLVEEINWELHGFQVTGTAENGREALEWMEKEMPDIVVTDIQMPFMNGLELAAWIREHAPSTKIIILTGYDEFEYAQKAIKLQIDEYVLKPFSSRELVDVLLKVKTHMDAERAEKENVQLLMEHYRKSIPVLRELFLSSLVTRRLTPEEYIEKGASYGISLDGQTFMASIIRPDPVQRERDVREEAEDPASAMSLKYSEDRYLLLFAVYNVAAEICQLRQGFKAFIHHNDCVLLSVLPEADESAAAQRTLELLEEIRLNVNKYLKLTVTAGAGSVYRSLGDVFDSYAEASQALDYRPILGNNRVIWIDDVEQRKADPLVFDSLKEQELVRSIRVGTAEELEETVRRMFDGLESSKVSVQDCQVYIIGVLTAVIRVAKEFGIELEEVFGRGSLPFADMYHYNNLQELREWIHRVSSRLMITIAQGRQSGYNQLVEDAKAYIHEHYRESDISINKVCRYLHISTGYFSSIFKKEMKMTFVAYLLHVRMEAAKEMLRSTSLKAFEIAETLGFADPNYFSFCFRKKFGITPKEYRSGHGGGESA